MNWSHASGSHEEAAVPDAHGATQQKQQTGGGGLLLLRAPAAEDGAGRRWGE